MTVSPVPLRPLREWGPTDVKTTYSRHHSPIGTVAPGEHFVIETLDCFSGRFREPSGYMPENIAWVERNLDVVTGPVAVDGAEPGMVVAIEIHSMEITTPGSVVRSSYRDPSPHDWWLEQVACASYRIEDGEVVFSSELRIPVRPLIGCIATAPEVESVRSVAQGTYGGNMDCNEIGPGATVLLPVNVAGALLYFGDCKAIMADGEITQPPEVGTRIEVSVTLLDRPAEMSWPRVITEERLTTVVSWRSLGEAARQAFRELLLWVESSFELTRQDAAMLLGMVAEPRLCQVCNALPTARCSIERRWLETLRENTN